MPSPSPTSRRSTSSVASRNFSGSSRSDLLAPRGLQQSFHTNFSDSAASQALHENIDDHKENSTENVISRGVPGKLNQKGPSKKPWVTHFARPATTLSPSNRVLVDRNSSCSPVRLGSTPSGSGENLSDKKATKASTPREREEASLTPSKVKGVAELSKRIQQFLEDQDVLLGVKTGSSHEVKSASPSVTPAESGQHLSSSPYNPYRSPFFERPKFLRLNGNVSSTEEADFVAASVDGIDMLMAATTEELPLFEGNQVLVTPLQQIQYSTVISPSSTEDEEGRLAENSKEQILGAVTVEEASVDALEAKSVPILEGEANFLNELEAEVSKERTGQTPEEDDDRGMVQAPNQLHDGNLAREAESQQGKVNVADIEVKEDTVNATSQEGSQVCQDELQNLSLESPKTDEVVHTVDGDDVSWGKRTVRLISCTALLVTFLSLVLLSSASPGLLPLSLVNNRVNSFWQSSKYHEHSMMLVRGMDGLWSTEMTYFPADAHAALMKGAELFQAINELSNQARQELQIYVRVASSVLDDWGRILVQQLSLSMNPDAPREHEDRARQFEWIQEYEFEEEWVDEIPKLAYTDWELLHEYDLGAANHFVLGSIPESLKNDLRRNFSRLTDSPDVRDLLEDLMKLKGGSTEEDRLEVLQYFWEYRRFSASAHESLRKFQFETPAIKDSREMQDFSSSSNHQNVESDSENVELCDDKGEQMIQSTDINKLNKENNYQTPTDEHPKLFEDDDQQLDDLAEQHLEKMELKQEQIVLEMSETASDELQESIVYETSQTLVSTVYEGEAVWTELVHELQRKVGNADTSSTSEVGLDIQPIEHTSDVKFDIPQLATLVTFIVASFFILGRINRQSTNVTKVISHASSVQFLRKSDQPPNSSSDEVQQNRQLFADVKQDKKQVTMIEELNDKFTSVLQSPEPPNFHLRSPHARKDEDIIRSPISTSAASPYGSFTTYKMMPKKEGQATETKLTPVRRSSRIRNHVSMSPNASGVKRIAISPP